MECLSEANLSAEFNTAYIIILRKGVYVGGIVSLLGLNIHFGTNIGKTNEFYLFKENLDEQFLIKTARFHTSLVL